jgi:ornithine carbamoyltransferase
MHRRSAFRDPNAVAGREMMERTGPTSGLEAIGEALGPADSIVIGQAATALYAIKGPSCSQNSAGS